MKHFKTEAIILKRKNIGEADKLLTVLSKKHGKMQIKAVGIRKLTSRRSPHVELFNLSELSLYRGRSIPVLTEVVSRKHFPEIKDDLTKVGFAYHICELIDGLCAEGQENEYIYHLLVQTFMRLCGSEDILTIIHEFEIELLTSLGFYRHSEFTKMLNTAAFIEQILEKKLKTHRMLHKFS